MICFLCGDRGGHFPRCLISVGLCDGPIEGLLLMPFKMFYAWMNSAYAYTSSSKIIHCHSLHANASANTLHSELITWDQTESLFGRTAGVFGDAALSWHLIMPSNWTHTNPWKLLTMPHVVVRQAGLLFKVGHNERWPWGQHVHSFPKQTATSPLWMTETWPDRHCSCVWQATRQTLECVWIQTDRSIFRDIERNNTNLFFLIYATYQWQMKQKGFTVLLLVFMAVICIVWI